MGSRATVLLCRDAGAARARFGAPGDGALWSRTGRPLFAPAPTQRLVGRLRAAAERAGVFDELASGWVLLDAEVLPWNAKAADLLRTHYAPVGAAARAMLPAASVALHRAAARGVDVSALRERTAARAAHAEAYTAAYRRYCHPIGGPDGLHGVRVAPFAVLAADGAVLAGRPHRWHLDTADRLVAADPALVAPTARVEVDVTDADSVAHGVRWWTALTDAGGEGMVVKPAEDAGGRVQPGVKVRGPEYLRIVYGPDYLEPQHLDRLRRRSLGRKRSLALREHALGVEALERLARGEPLWRVHECVAGVLALESEPVDPSL